MNIFETKKTKFFLDLTQKLFTLSSFNTIMKRKKFLIYQKLLVLRNIFCIKDTNIKMKLKIYFYNWKRLLTINNNNSFEKKIFLRKIVNEKISQSDYFTRLMKYSFINFLKFYRNFSEKNNRNYYENENEQENNYEENNNNNNEENIINNKDYNFLSLEEKEKIRNKIIDIRTVSSNVKIIY